MARLLVQLRDGRTVEIYGTKPTRFAVLRLAFLLASNPEAVLLVKPLGSPDGYSEFIQVKDIIG
jgi:hypothetical protein